MSQLLRSTQRRGSGGTGKVCCVTCCYDSARSCSLYAAHMVQQQQQPRNTSCLYLLGGSSVASQSLTHDLLALLKHSHRHQVHDCRSLRCRIAACLHQQAGSSAGAAASLQASAAVPASTCSRLQAPAVATLPAGGAQMAQWLAGAACEANMMQLLLAQPAGEAAQQQHMLQALVSAATALGLYRAKVSSARHIFRKQPAACGLLSSQEPGSCS